MYFLPLFPAVDSWYLISPASRASLIKRETMALFLPSIPKRSRREALVMGNLKVKNPDCSGVNV